MYVVPKVLFQALFCLAFDLPAIASTISSYGWSLQQTADDTRVFISPPPSLYVINCTQLEKCLADQQLQFCYSSLSLNVDKTNASTSALISALTTQVVSWQM